MNATLLPPTSLTGRGAAVEPPRRVLTKKLRAFGAAFYRDFWPFLPLAVALLGFVVVVAASLSWDGNRRTFHWINLRELMDLFNREAGSLAAVICAMVGVAMGICQARGDLPANIWGFIKHRPAGAGLLLGARVAAGGVLYAIAVGVPMAALVACSAAYSVPFVRQEALPLVADTLMGLVYYLAGLLVAQRQASWLGTRLLPLVGAVIGSAGVIVVPEFSQALGIIGVGVVVYGAAVLGAMASDGYRLRAPLAARGALMVVLLAGFTPVLVGLSWIGEGVVARYTEWDWSIHWSTHWDTPEIRAEIYAWRHNYWRMRIRGEYMLLPDATLIEGIHKPLPADEWGYIDVEREMTWERVNAPGIPYRGVPEPFIQPDGTSRDEEVIHSALTVHFSSLRIPDFHQHMGYRDNTVVAATHGAKAGEMWYYVQPPGIWQLYDEAGGYLGSMGAKGFAPRGTAGAPFGYSYNEFSIIADQEVLVPDLVHDQWTVIPAKEAGAGYRLTTASGIMDVDLGQRTVTPTWRFPEGVKVVGVSDTVPPMVVSTHALYIYEPGDMAHPAREVPLAFAVSNVEAIRVWYAQAARRWAIFYQGHKRIDFYDEAWQKVATQAVPEPSWERVTEAPAPPPPEGYERFEANLADRALMCLGFLHAACDMPCLRLADAWARHEPSNLFYRRLDVGPWGDGGIRMMVYESRSSPWYIVAAGATLLAGGLWMRLLARRYGVRWGALWIAGAVIFGPVMLLVLMAMHRLPGREVCAGCGKPRLTTGARCEHCGAGFAEPERRGNEIFTESNGGAT